MRMSEILRGGFGKETPSEKKLLFTAEKTPLEPAPKKEVPPPSEAPPKVAAESLYHDLLKFVEELLTKAKEGRAIDGREIQQKVEPLLDRVMDPEEVLMYLATTRSTPEYYLYAHAVNVAILALRLGNALGYDRERLLTLGVGALLQDIGMVRVMDIAEKKEALTPEEWEEIRRHPQHSVDILKAISNLPSVCLYIAENAHERRNGSGYPQGLSGRQLSEEAQVVAIVDVYEALTHSRSYRNKLLPYEALKEILKNKELFDPRILKTFVQHITVYPVGCWVELSTDEVGRVFRVTPTLPLRPSVKLFFDSQMRPLHPEKELDLAQHSTLYVKRVLDEKELEEKKERGFG